MKKIVGLMLALAMVLALGACGGSSTSGSATNLPSPCRIGRRNTSIPLVKMHGLAGLALSDTQSSRNTPESLCANAACCTKY